jgi:hypothetical protein
MGQAVGAARCGEASESDVEELAGPLDCWVKVRTGRPNRVRAERAAAGQACLQVDLDAEEILRPSARCRTAVMAGDVQRCVRRDCADVANCTDTLWGS